MKNDLAAGVRQNDRFIEPAKLNGGLAMHADTFNSKKRGHC